MKNPKFPFSFLILLMLLPILASAQLSGNVSYRENNNYNQGGSPAGTRRNSIQVTDSDIYVTGTVLLNLRPDALVVTLGLNEEAKTVEECNNAINKRIAGFCGRVKSLKVNDDDVYIDFISQTRIYDYEVTAAQAKQFDNGFEIKKNLIIRLTDIDALDKLTKIAAEYSIYDIVKAEYVVNDTEAVYDKLFEESLKIINSKKDRYVKSFKADLAEPRLLEDNYYSLQPKTQYQSYKAFETSDVSVTYNRNADTPYVRKEERKNNTFYYQGADTSGIDKVINASTPEVCLQYVVEMKVAYHVKK
jgi:uncharacterized protein YggE